MQLDKERRLIELQKKRMRDDLLGMLGCAAVCIGGAVLIALLAGWQP